MKDTMKAVVFKELGSVVLEDRPVPAILHPKDAIVRVTLAAICSSDIHIKHGMIAKAKEGGVGLIMSEFLVICISLIRT